MPRSRTVTGGALVGRASWGLLAVSASALALAACSPTGTQAKATTTTTAPPGSTTTQAEATTTTTSRPRIGQTANDGEVAFTVTSVQCGVTHVGSGDSGRNVPSGSQWCLTYLTVSNEGTQPLAFAAANEDAVDAAGHQLPVDTSAVPYLTGDTKAISATVAPGARLDVVEPFQLGASDSITAFVLHASPSSAGVTVANTN